MGELGTAWKERDLADTLCCWLRAGPEDVEAFLRHLDDVGADRPTSPGAWQSAFLRWRREGCRPAGADLDWC